MKQENAQFSICGTTIHVVATSVKQQNYNYNLITQALFRTTGI